MEELILSPNPLSEGTSQFLMCLPSPDPPCSTQLPLWLRVLGLTQVELTGRKTNTPNHLGYFNGLWWYHLGFLTHANEQLALAKVAHLETVLGVENNVSGCTDSRTQQGTKLDGPLMVSHGSFLSWHWMIEMLDSLRIVSAHGHAFIPNNHNCIN